MPKYLTKTVLFLVLTFFFSYLLVFGFLALGGNFTGPWSLVIPIIFMFIPMTITIIVQKVVYKEPVKGPLGVSFRLNRWFIVAWLFPPILAAATFGVSLLLPGVEFAPGMEGFLERFQGTLTPEQIEQMRSQTSILSIHPVWLTLIQGLIAGVTVNAVAAFGEELGWRGLLFKELGRFGFWPSSLIVGLVWGLWHAPLILQGHNYPQHPQLGVAMMTVFTLLWSPVFTYIRARWKSVIAAAILHGTLNGTFGISILLVKGGDDLTVGGTGLAGFIVIVLANLGIVVFDRFWAKEPIIWGRVPLPGTASDTRVSTVK